MAIHERTEHYYRKGQAVAYTTVKVVPQNGMYAIRTVECRHKDQIAITMEHAVLNNESDAIDYANQLLQYDKCLHHLAQAQEDNAKLIKGVATMARLNNRLLKTFPNDINVQKMASTVMRLLKS